MLWFVNWVCSMVLSHLRGVFSLPEASWSAEVGGINDSLDGPACVQLVCALLMSSMV